MKKYVLLILAVVVLLLFISGIFYYNLSFINNENINEDNGLTQEQEKQAEETIPNGDFAEISVDDVKGITQEEAVKLCYAVLGEKDADTGFQFSFGISGAVEKDKKQYYVIRASWLVNNSHLSYIGDFFVSADGKELYNGLALNGEYKMSNLVWSK